MQYVPLRTRIELRQHLFEYIEVDYNRQRRHSSLNYLNLWIMNRQSVLNSMSTIGGADQF
ncbi:hypothetical protein EHLJMEHL_00434 [Vreelandella titanicae]